MENTLNFNTRETYIAWRAEWRTEYATTSQQIREARNTIKNAQRENKWAGMWNHYSTLARSQRTARELLALREASKIEAGKQFAAQKELSCA